MSRWFGSKHHRGRRNKLSIQSLENRSVLAGDVVVTLSNFVVSITGDGDDNEILITADASEPGRIVVEGLNGTTINGLTDPVEVETLSDLRINMLNGSDSVQFNGNGGSLQRDLIVFGGNGDNTFEMTGGYTVGRDVRITNLTGFDTNNIQALEARDLYFANGNGGSNTNVFGNNVAGRDLIIVNGSATGNFNQVNVEESAVTRHISINSGTADINFTNVVNSTVGDDLTIRHGNAATANLVQLGGTGTGVAVTDDLTVINGNGPNNIFVTEGSVGGIASLRNGSGAVGSVTVVTDLAVTEDLLINNGTGGNRSVVIDGGTVGDDVVVSNGASFQSAVTITGAGITGDLTVTNGNGDNIISIVAATAIGGNVNLRNGNAPTTGSQLAIDDATIGGSLNLINAHGDHSIQIGATAAVTIGRTATLRNGNGDITIEVDNTEFGQDLQIQNANANAGSTTQIGVTTPVTIGRDLGIRSGNGGHNIQVNAATITRSLIVTTLGGDDTIALEGTAAGNLSIGSATNLSTGAGEDTVNLGVDAGGTADFAGLVTVRLGNGNDSLTIGETATLNIPSIQTALFYLDGGADHDTLTVTAGTAFDPIDPLLANKIKNFEVVTT